MELTLYLIINESAALYNVSRGKLHRLVKQGRVRTASDPRDERATLLRIEDLDHLFEFSEEATREMKYNSWVGSRIEGTGRLTQELADQMDELRKRISGGKRSSVDSVAVIRDEREKRSRHLDRVIFGKDLDEPAS